LDSKTDSTPSKLNEGDVDLKIIGSDAVRPNRRYIVKEAKAKEISDYGDITKVNESGHADPAGIRESVGNILSRLNISNLLNESFIK